MAFNFTLFDSCIVGADSFCLTISAGLCPYDGVQRLLFIALLIVGFSQEPVAVAAAPTGSAGRATLSIRHLGVKQSTRMTLPGLLSVTIRNLAFRLTFADVAVVYAGSPDMPLTYCVGGHAPLLRFKRSHGPSAPSK